MPGGLSIRLSQVSSQDDSNKKSNNKEITNPEPSDIDLTYDATAGAWILAEMPAYDVELELICTSVKNVSSDTGLEYAGSGTEDASSRGIWGRWDE